MVTLLGHIIGVRGTGLHRLQKLSGANVHVSKPSETPKSLVDRVVTFIGTICYHGFLLSVVL